MYTIKEKTVEGITQEVSKGLAIIAVYFKTTLGIDEDEFELMLNTKVPMDSGKTLFYLNFRNTHPQLF